MLSNFDLEEYAREQRFPIVGVFSKDELNDMRPEVGSYYINMQDSIDKKTGKPLGGTHWIFFRILPHPYNKAIYFDSFGEYAPKDVDDFLHHYKPYVRSDRQIQDLNSEECGYFCLATDKYFTDHYDKKMNVDDNFCNYLSIYSNDFKLNDKIVKEYLKKTI